MLNIGQAHVEVAPGRLAPEPFGLARRLELAPLVSAMIYLKSPIIGVSSARPGFGLGGP